MKWFDMQMRKKDNNDKKINYYQYFININNSFMPNKNKMILCIYYMHNFNIINYKINSLN